MFPPLLPNTSESPSVQSSKPSGSPRSSTGASNPSERFQVPDSGSKRSAIEVFFFGPDRPRCKPNSMAQNEQLRLYNRTLMKRDLPAAVGREAP